METCPSVSTSQLEKEKEEWVRLDREITAKRLEARRRWENAPLLQREMHAKENMEMWDKKWQTELGPALRSIAIASLDAQWLVNLLSEWRRNGFYK